MKNPKDFVASLARGIDIIRSFTAPPGNEHPGAPTPVGPTDALTLSQVAVRAGVARAVARRFLLTLADLGYVATDGKYFRLTARVLDLGYAYLSSMPFSNLATEFLQEVSEQTKESFFCNVEFSKRSLHSLQPQRHSNICARHVNAKQGGDILWPGVCIPLRIVPLRHQARNTLHFACDRPGVLGQDRGEVVTFSHRSVNSYRRINSNCG